ncbi:MAG: SCO6880 family protein [Acidimicrobiales bacterium]
MDRSGLIAGWRGGQVACAVGSLLLALMVLKAGWGWVGPVLAIAVVAAGVGAACWPIGGQTIEQWCPIVVSWLLRRGVRNGVVGVAMLGRRRDEEAGSMPGAGAGSRALPPGLAELSGCRLLSPQAHLGGLGMGVIHDRASRTFSSVIGVRGQSFALLDAEDKHRRVTAWSSLMAGLAREDSVIHRLAWVRRTIPDDAEAVSRFLVANAKLELDSPPGASYASLVEQAGPLTQRHQVFIVLSIRPPRLARGSDQDPVATACGILARETRALQDQLRNADIDVIAALGPVALAHCLRQAIQDRSVQAPGPIWPWPLATETTWSALRTDALWHGTYWISEWPRIDVGPDFLSPLLLRSGARQSIAVVMEPIAPSRAVREVEQARVGGMADEELRRRAGFVLTARRRREHEVSARRETELADGHADFRFSGYVTVSAANHDDLEEAGARVEQAGAQARLELRRLYGQQDRAFTWTLPMARGLA